MRHLVEYFIRFKKFIGHRIYYLLLLMLIIGFVEGIGVTLFLPVLQSGFGDDTLSQILKSIFGFLHLDFSLKLLLAFILAFFILRAVSLISYARYFSRLMANLEIELRQRVLGKVFTADYLYLLKREIGYLNNAILREIARVVDAFKNFSEVLKYVVHAAIYTILSLLFNFAVTLVVIGISPILLIFMRKINMRISHVSRQRSLSFGKFNSIVIQCLSKLKYLKATLSHIKISKIVEKENKNLGNLRFQMFFLQSLAKNLFEPVIVLTVVGLLFYYVVILQRSVNEIMFLVFLFIQIARQFLNVQSSYRKFLTSMGSIEVFNSLERELEENKESLNPDGIVPDFNKDVTLRDVTVIFSNGKIALDNVNIDIKPKTTVAFVGYSGSGKSTIANMITGLIKPTNGEMLLGDVNYDKFNLKILRENIGYITQEDIIFNARIKDNISLWDENAAENKLAKVIEMARITGFVNGLPEKQNSMLGDNGLDISGGQRQRITIARELYKDTKLLIMDEATSSLDSKAENQIYENLREFKGKKTMVVIAHRLSTIRNADYVYVLDEGRVVEEGTYDELNQQRGEFTKMVEAQKLT